jgi:hypothetical protein
MDNSKTVENWTEAGYYLIAAACAVATTLIAAEMLGYNVRGRYRHWQHEVQWKLRQEQFNFFYEQIWPALRKARHHDAGQSDS